MKHILEADSIQLEFNGRKILSDIYIKSETGMITGLLGRNGEGKSCLMQIIYGTLKSQKSVRIDNSSRKAEFRSPGLLRYLPQFNFIPKSLSLQRVFDDYELNYQKFQTRFSEFKNRSHEKINAFSGGEHRLIELYLIVTAKSHFALLDEPFTHLNPLQIEKVRELLIEEKENKGILITDHMYRNVTEISDSLYVLSKGKTHLTKDPFDIEALGYTNRF
jgi:ABC-type lipopolysaccharide export system ATPase subunit